MPVSAPVPTTLKNCRMSEPAVGCVPDTKLRTSPKRTSEVPSFQRLSPLTRTLRRCGAPIARKRLTTAIGSVAAMTAPKTSPCAKVKPPANGRAFATETRRTAVRRIDARTPGTASVGIANRFFQKSPRSR